VNLRTYLDADWDRLQAISSNAPQPRRWLSAMHPRFAPVTVLRYAQCLHAAGWTRLAKLFSLLNVVIFGIEVPAKLSIGPGLIITHANGIVLGPARIGCNATIYQQVTLGALEADFFDPTSRPIIEDNVILAAGAKVLGPITVGSGCVIGANAVVLDDVPPNHLAVGVPARMTPRKSNR